MRAEFPENPASALLALLDWYAAVGVDLALDDAPHDRYADSARVASAPVVGAPAAPARREPPPAIAPETQAARPRVAAIAAPDEAVRAAEAAAASANNLQDLAAALAEFPHAPFRDMAQHFLFGAGAPGARLMVLDAAPGATEESTGEAFSGLQAKLLDNMLAAIGHNRESAYLAYVSPWRPPGDRNLTPPEAATFAPFARRHLELARPEVLLLFGDAPARVMLATTEPLAKLRGKPFDIASGAHMARAFVFSGLDSMLKSPALKPAAWRDLRAAAGSLRA
ncbi:uracil-DNA glycosylase [Methylocystis iwaonis]|uniref:Uracil-DNA glycosylase n=1 Tax=Methylocystis iwaonis TaxID=2885079 RepID=A0ABM8E456_9HYPH|nr:uracil-DNA glycosylase [Methylocystis iwaonis]BDV32785.1 uracil-DNA glycosylase [Methylocystis iwaonis]